MSYKNYMRVPASSEKQHRDAIARESRSPVRAARADSGFAKWPFANLFFDVLRQFVQVRHFKTDHRFCRSPPKSCIILTRFPRAFRCDHGSKPHRTQQRNHFLFRLLHAQFRNGARKILHREEPARSVHSGDYYGGEPRIQNVFAVAGRIHPAAVNDRRTRADSDVFRDGAEARAGFREPSFQIRFTGKLVLEHIQICHAQSVLARGFEESIVPLKRTEILCSAFAIESFEKLPFGIVALELRLRVDGNKKEKSSNDEKFEFSRCSEGRL